MSSSWPKFSEGTYASLETADYGDSRLNIRPEYPHRYYIDLLKKSDPGYAGYKDQVKMWFDAWRISSVENFPPASALIPITIEQWDYHNIADDHGIMLHLRAQLFNGEIRDIPWD